MSDKDRIAARVEELASPVAASLGQEIVQVVYRREAEGWILRILIDRAGGVNVEDCRAFSRELSDVLDVEDPVPTAYRLEVSSPGLDRPLVRAEHFTRFAGSRVRVITRKAIDDRKKFTGQLLGMEGDQVLLSCDGQQIEIGLADIKGARLVPEFAPPKKPGH